MIKNDINSYTECTPMPKVLLIPMVFDPPPERDSYRL